MSDSSFGDTGFGDSGFGDSGFGDAGFGDSDFDTSGSELGTTDFGSGTDLGTTDFGSGTDLGTTDLGSGTDFGTTGFGSTTGFDGGSGFSVTPAALTDVSSTFDGLIGDGRDAAGTLGGLSLDPASYGSFGAPVATAAQSLMSNHTTALDGTLSGLGTINTGIAASNAGYLDADQAVSLGFGGLPTSGGIGSFDPFSTASPTGPTFTDLPADQQQAVDTLNGQDLTTSGLTLGTTPYDPFSTTTTPTGPTFTDLPADQQQAVDTLNTQDTQPTTPAGLADDATLQAQLQQHEGAKNHVYTDTMGHPTVGIGFNLDRSGAANALSAVGADYTAVRNGTQDLTDAQISQLAHTDTQHAVDVARNYYSGFDQLDPARQRALVDMTFNLDNKINQFTGLHQALVDGDWNSAANHIANSAFARQTGVRGTDLTNQMRNGGQ